MKKRSLLSLFCILLFSTALPLAAWAVEDADVLNDRLQSQSRRVRIDVAKTLTSSGIQDPQVYVTIEKILLDNLDNPSQEKEHIDEMSWMCKALAASGDPQYAKTLNRVASSTSNMKLRNYARQSLELIPTYARRAEEINRENVYGEGFSDEDVQLANMVSSDLPRLKKDGAKRIIRSGTTNEQLFDIVNDELLKLYTPQQTGRNEVDLMAWFCKALAASGNIKYAPTLEKIADTTASINLQKYARSSLKSLISAN